GGQVVGGGAAGVAVEQHAAAVVEDLADGYAALQEFGAGRLDVGDDQVEALEGSGLGGGQSLAEHDRRLGARGREVHGAPSLDGGLVHVEAEARPLVEGLGTVDVGDGQDDEFQLQVHGVVHPLREGR